MELQNVAATFQTWSETVNRLDPLDRVVVLHHMKTPHAPIGLHILNVDVDQKAITTSVLFDADTFLKRHVTNAYYATLSRLSATVLITKFDPEVIITFVIAPSPVAARLVSNAINHPRTAPPPWTVHATRQSPFPAARVAPPFLNSMYSRYRERVAQNKDFTFHVPPSDPSSSSTTTTAAPLATPTDPPMRYVQPELRPRSTIQPSFTASSFSNGSNMLQRAAPYNGASAYGHGASAYGNVTYGGGSTNPAVFANQRNPTSMATFAPPPSSLPTRTFGNPSSSSSSGGGGGCRSCARSSTSGNWF